MCAGLHTFTTRSESRKMPMCANPHTCMQVGTGAQATELPPVGRTARKGVHCLIPNQNALADRPFVQSVDSETEAIVRRGRVLRERDRFLQVYYNEETGTTAFALIEDQQRIRGVDYTIR